MQEMIMMTPHSVQLLIEAIRTAILGQTLLLITVRIICFTWPWSGRLNLIIILPEAFSKRNHLCHTYKTLLSLHSDNFWRMQPVIHEAPPKENIIFTYHCKIFLPECHHFHVVWSAAILKLTRHCILRRTFFNLSIEILCMI